MVQFVGDTEKVQEAAGLVKERLGDSAGGPVLTDSEADCGVALCVRLSAGQMP